MSWWVGAGLGFLRGGPLGAIVGGAIEHFASKKWAKVFNKNLPGLKNRPMFVFSLVALLSRIAKSKGGVTSLESNIIFRFLEKNLGVKEDGSQQISTIIRETQRVNPAIEPLVTQYRQASGNLYLILLLGLAYQVALVGTSETRLNEDLQKDLKTLSDALGVSYDDHNRIRDKYGLFLLKTPYSVLGLTSSASDTEIRKAYRQLAREYHPDTVSHLGADLAEQAHVKFLEIQSAYRELEKKRGL